MPQLDTSSRYTYTYKSQQTTPSTIINFQFTTIPGKLCILNSYKEIVDIKQENGYFGELALLAPAKRKCTVLALSHLDLIILRSFDLASAMGHFPESAEQVRINAVIRLQRAGMIPEAEESTKKLSLITYTLENEPKNAVQERWWRAVRRVLRQVRVNRTHSS